MAGGMGAFFHRLVWTACLALLFAACQHDAYDTGDSRYSYLRTDFAEVSTDGNGAMWRAVTDDGDSLAFISAMQPSWATKPDSVYRALLYYSLRPATLEAPASDAAATKISVEPLSASMVYVLKPIRDDDALSLMTDPVVFQSAWTSRSGKYVNLGLALMTGQPESDDARQTIGVVCDTVTVDNNGNRMFHFRFCHAQGGVPEYYKSAVYASIPVSGMRAGDAVSITVPTYDGTVVRVFRF